MKLPGEKIKKIRTETRKLKDQDNPQAIALSRLLGKLNHATQAIPPAPLFHRNLQSCLQGALEAGDQDYVTPVRPTLECREKLVWWERHLTNWNRRCLFSQKPSLVMETDASTTDREASCEGVQTGGPWSETKSLLHINCLELLAATLAVKCFARDKKDNTILLKMDNTTAIAYINKLGGTVSPELNRLTKDLWL